MGVCQSTSNDEHNNDDQISAEDGCKAADARPEAPLSTPPPLARGRTPFSPGSPWFRAESQPSEAKMLAAKLAAATPQQLHRIEHPGDIYGVSLDEAVSRSDPEGESPTGRVTHNWCCLTGLVPYQITHLCQWIEKNALAVEGIFRSAALD